MFHKITAATIVIVAAGSLVANAFAQERPVREAERGARRDTPVSVDTKKAPDIAQRVSEIDGMKVRNTANKELGTIKDIVVDARSGMVKYATLSYGGFLGLGDKLFAVPWDALQLRHAVNDGDSYLVMDIDEATLKQSPGFEDSAWPNFGDEKYRQQIDSFYHKYRKTGADANDQATVNSDLNSEVNRTDAKVATTDKHQPLFLRSSAIMDMKVKNEAQKELGKVSDLVIAMRPGKIRYAALSYGGFLGLGDKLFAVPWKAFEFRHDISSKEFTMVLDVEEATLRKATGFDQDNWPNFADPSITDQLDKHYGVTGDATTSTTTGGAIVRERKDR